MKECLRSASYSVIMTSVSFALLYDVDQNTVDLLDDFLWMQNKTNRLDRKLRLENVEQL